MEGVKETVIHEEDGDGGWVDTELQGNSKFSINTYLCICIGVGVVQDKVAEMSLEGKVGRNPEGGRNSQLVIFFECSRM